MFKLTLRSLTIFLMVAVINSEIHPFEQCSDIDTDLCEIKQVRVSPCQRDDSGYLCSFKGGDPITIDLDFVPHFNAEDLVHYYSFSDPSSEVSLPVTKINQCYDGECPLRKGELKSYQRVIRARASQPGPKNYNMKWKFVDTKNRSHGCCFTFPLILLPN
ncbi:unnamed protein product [Tenebrio molitor]|nr:unnamed protein product [Tenebrio molitor]